MREWGLVCLWEGGIFKGAGDPGEAMGERIWDPQDERTWTPSKGTDDQEREQDKCKGERIY